MKLNTAKYSSKSRKYVDNQRGASMLEYSMIAALIALVCVAAVVFLGEEASETFCRSASAMDDGSGGPCGGATGGGPGGPGGGGGGS